jgi:hypothetical protein
MAVSLIDGGVGSEAVEITVSFYVIDPAALGAFDDDVKGMVVVGAVVVFKLYEFLSAGAFQHGWHKSS